MTLRKWFYLLWTTGMIGTLTALMVGFGLLSFIDNITIAENFTADYNWITAVFIVLIGSTVSVLSHMGFFSYMITRYIALGILRNRTRWDIVQGMLIAVAVIDFIYLRVTAGDVNQAWTYAILPIVVFVISALTAYWKVKQTNRTAFVPTLFFMYVVTVLEAVPALKVNSFALDIFMFAVLLACNGWQIMVLHKVLERVPKHLQQATVQTQEAPTKAAVQQSKQKEPAKTGPSKAKKRKKK